MEIIYVIAVILFPVVAWALALRERHLRKKTKDELRIVEAVLKLSDEELQDRDF